MAKSGSKMLLAAAVGLAVGVGIGLLFAPAKGSKTRKRLKKLIRSAADTIQDDISNDISELQSIFSGDEEEITSKNDNDAKGNKGASGTGPEAKVKS